MPPLYLTASVTLSEVRATPVVPQWIYSGQNQISDPVNLIWHGYGQAWWIENVIVNYLGWDAILFCAETAYLNSDGTHAQDRQVENPPNNCADRYHVRIWDMGYDPLWGYWAVGGAHIEHVECCFRHVISQDGWELAENEVLTEFASLFPHYARTRIWIDNQGCIPAGSSSCQPNDGYAAFITIPDTFSPNPCDQDPTLGCCISPERCPVGPSAKDGLG